MTKRLLSLLLAVIMLLTVCIGTVSCNFGTDEGTGDGTTDDTGNGTGDGTGNSGTSEEEDGGDWVMPEDEYTIEREEGCNQLTIYISLVGQNKTYDPSVSDIWCWWEDKAGQGYLLNECDFGYKIVLNIPETVKEVGFIVRTYCSEPGGDSWASATKLGTEENRFIVMNEEGDTTVYLKAEDAAQYSSNNGGKTLKVIKKFTIAGITELANRKGYGVIRYNLTPATTITSLDQIKVFDGDRQLDISVSKMGSSTTSADITVKEALDISKTYRVVIEGYGELNAVPTDVFDTNYFKNNYHYDGTDLGATINDDGTTTFKVWAPTASKVVLNLYKDGKKGVSSEGDVSYDMTGGGIDEKGVWSFTAPNCGHGTFYTYTVSTSVGVQETIDPYAKSAGVNGDRGMVVDLSLTNPEGWSDDLSFSTGIDSYSDAIIWEIHIRDFSNTITDENLPEEYRGKYLAFTQEGLVNGYGQPVGIDYLKKLGVTHVHILPSYDYATVDEDYLAEGYEEDFNWGYDPKNYNVPEGSYSTNPYDGVTRIIEYKQMVMALHEAGIGVIMDVVYNHTFDANASFNKIVPYYYYRYTTTGSNSSASGCGNDTASERYMFGKFIVDSTSYWLSEYNLDGFRFDLMGLHDLTTMQEVESALHTIDPTAVLYGEGWTMGATTDNSLQANQSNIKRITATNGAIGTIAVFNDTIRDALSSSFWDGKISGQGYITGNYSSTYGKVLFGVYGGEDSSNSWYVYDDMVINYMSCHDNNTLWDKISIAQGSKPVETRLAMNRLGATILFASQGAVFFQAGEEMLRTKPHPNGGYDHNSYNSSDEVNNIKWEVLTGTSHESQMVDYYAGLIAIRKTYDVFTDYENNTLTNETKGGGAQLILKYSDGNGGEVIVVTNATANSYNYTLSGDWHVLCDGVNASADSIKVVNGSVPVPAYSAVIIVNQAMYDAAHPVVDGGEVVE